MHFSSSLLSHASSLIKNGEPMALNITKEVANMERLSVGALCERYRKVFGEDTKARNKQWLTNHVRRKTSRNAPPQITRRQADRVGRRQGPPAQTPSNRPLASDHSLHRSCHLLRRIQSQRPRPRLRRHRYDWTCHSCTRNADLKAR
jgi:hypothetical protein